MIIYHNWQCKNMQIHDLKKKKIRNVIVIVYIF